MKLNEIFFIYIITLFFYSCNTPLHLQKPKYYQDKDGDSIRKNKFLESWRDRDQSFSRWDYYDKDSGRVAQLHNYEYYTYEVKYQLIKKQIESVTNRKISDTTIFLINYNYLNDLCTYGLEVKEMNTWDKKRVLERKNWMQPWVEYIEKNYPNVIFLVFFEGGIKLSNTSSPKEEYFFLDKHNFFRNSIFKHPTCNGSYALIKSNGETLIRNGENAASGFVQHLDKHNWNLFFP
ncbi:hypothetical protein [Gramella sp. MAR_2010_147]|uniref:hypothetical protein n=1 Tax=Gramella sp. MAR_2010_147 TaxID=1250205 RepID=UPI00087CA69C|nr:hypothetical protein [Gramella sp. MAR_2010_147]SDS58467.1 hypothetical protein SAMN04488553_2594 [Gramella sp. MAR_2010_147]